MREYVGPPLTRESLAALLDREGIHECAYSLYGSHTSDAFVMDQRPQGWVVFYSERGEECGLRLHPDEAGACLDLLQRVWDDEPNRFAVVAGPAPPDQADQEFGRWLHGHGLTRRDLADADWRMDDSPWEAGQPHFRRYWVRITRIRATS